MSIKMIYGSSNHSDPQQRVVKKSSPFNPVYVQRTTANNSSPRNPSHKTIDVKGAFTLWLALLDRLT